MKARAILLPYVDFQKAFDKTEHQKLFKSLLQKGPTWQIFAYSEIYVIEFKSKCVLRSWPNRYVHM